MFSQPAFFDSLDPQMLEGDDECPRGDQRAGDQAHVMAGLRDFVLPYIALRNRGKGYAVSIVKAGMRIVGRDAGPVRSPLTDLSSQEEAELRVLIDRAKG